MIDFYLIYFFAKRCFKKRRITHLFTVICLKSPRFQFSNLDLINDANMMTYSLIFTTSFGKTQIKIEIYNSAKRIYETLRIIHLFGIICYVLVSKVCNLGRRTYQGGSIFLAWKARFSEFHKILRQLLSRTYKLIPCQAA